MPDPTRTSARDRLLAAADELFYAEGIHTVGIDRVIERAGVAKASLYSAFGSKEELVRAYLLGRHKRREQRLSETLAEHDSPRAKLLAIFDYLADATRQPTFRGCAFINASAESPPSGPAREVTDLSRAWLRSLMRGLVDELGVAEPGRLVDQLVMVYDGAVVAARLDREPGSVSTARELAETLLNAAQTAVAPSDLARVGPARSDAAQDAVRLDTAARPA